MIWILHKLKYIAYIGEINTIVLSDKIHVVILIRYEYSCPDVSIVVTTANFLLSNFS